MIIKIDISPKMYEGIKELTNAGRYDSIKQFAEIAIENQLTVETQENGYETTASEKEVAAGPLKKVVHPQLQKAAINLGQANDVLGVGFDGDGNVIGNNNRGDEYVLSKYVAPGNNDKLPQSYESSSMSLPDTWTMAKKGDRTKREE
jgi:hypothetical protein